MTDFGMARNVHQDDIYTKQSRVRVFMELRLYDLYKLQLNTILLLVYVAIVPFT